MCTISLKEIYLSKRDSAAHMTYKMNEQLNKGIGVEGVERGEKKEGRAGF